MNRIATKFVVGVLLALLVGWIVDRGLIRPYRVQERRSYAAHMFGGLVHLLRQRAASLSPEEVQKELDSLAQQMGHQVRLLPQNHFRLTRSERQRISAGKVVLRGKDHDPVVVLAKSWQPDHLLVLGPLSSPNTRQRLFDIVSSVLGIISGVLVALFVAVPLVRRLYRLEHVAARIAQGDLSLRSQDCKNDEMGLLARRFNSMADSLEDLLKQQKQLIRAVSHELRTPIARLRFDLELLQSVQNEAQREQKMASMSSDIDELESLVAELLEFLRFRRGDQLQATQSVRVYDLAQELAAKYQPLRTEIELVLCAAEESKNIEITAELSSVARAVGNLLGNAMRFAQHRVELTCQQREKRVTICVDDDGPGIPHNMRAAVFEPFFRVDEDRNRNSGGAGLGLAIVQSIVQAHQGKIWIEDSPLGGARFVSEWPQEGQKSPD